MPKPKPLVWRIHPAQKRSGKPPVLRSGEPRAVALGVWEGDNAFRGEELTSCCRCGLDHLNVYEMFNQTGRLVLQVRSYRLGRKGRYYG